MLLALELFLLGAVKDVDIKEKESDGDDEPEGEVKHRPLGVVFHSSLDFLIAKGLGIVFIVCVLHSSFVKEVSGWR